MFFLSRFYCSNSFKIVIILFLCGLVVLNYILAHLTATKRTSPLQVVAGRTLVQPSNNNNSSSRLKNLPPVNGSNSEAFINVFITFTKASDDVVMKSKLERCVSSMMHFASKPVALNIIGDKISRKIAMDVLTRRIKVPKNKLKILTHDVDRISRILHPIVTSMQEHFSYKPGSYYSDPLFFLSIAFHTVFPIERAILLDIDLQFRSDVWELNQEFYYFKPEAMIGLVHEQQPVYRHVFHAYRNKNPGTLVGEPFPKGNPGFNSGVLLLELQRMRNSKAYKDTLNASVVDELVNKYSFKGHLGDQDFFTLISLEHWEFFHILHCGWNRQLCQWWRNHGYEDVFDKYHTCKERINIYHGNCNSAIPE